MKSYNKYDIIISRFFKAVLYSVQTVKYLMEESQMKHIKTINAANLKKTAEKGGCGKCQASCQSACKTSCTVANQKCENK